MRYEYQQHTVNADDVAGHLNALDGWDFVAVLSASKAQVIVLVRRRAAG